ncbi:MAG TPA: hypothetical protein VMV31_01925 [Terriglobales bacterium]|nr:hypothetical protein [Terriglobales bacterium]
MATIPPPKILTAYDALLSKFEDVAIQSNLTVCQGDLPLASSFERTGQHEFKFSRSIHLKGLKPKQRPRGQTLSVILWAQERFSSPEKSPNDWALVESNVRLNFFVEAKGQSRLVQALHYDFPKECPAAHPLFHVQLTDELLPPEVLDTLKVTATVKEGRSGPPAWVGMRIPTPDMTLSSVLYCAVASYLKDEIFAKFAEDYELLKNRLLHPRFDPITDSLRDSPSHFKSSHWFPTK